MGTTYIEEEHCRMINKISEGRGNISEEIFLDWYVDQLFNDEGYSYNNDSDNDNDSKEGNRENKDNTKTET